MDKLTHYVVEEWVKETTGVFTTRDIWQELDIGPGTNRDNLRKILQRLRQDNVITYVDGHHGRYRLLDTELEKMQLSSANPHNTINLKWPFGLESIARIYRKNVILVAGSKSSGKTAYLLNFMKMNMKHDLPIRYLNTDMGEEELRNRVEKFDDVTIEQWDEYIDMYDKAYVLPEHISPNAINIVDFLEVHDEFYKIGKPIKDMSAVLDKGILIIVAQKNKGAEDALGGQRILEKTKLAIFMDEGELWLREVKNWADGLTESPKGMRWRFKLLGGAKFIDVSRK